MTQEAKALLEAFEHLPPEDKRALADEILRRSLPFDSGEVSDADIQAVSAALFKSLDDEDGDTTSR